MANPVSPPPPAARAVASAKAAAVADLAAKKKAFDESFIGKKVRWFFAPFTNEDAPRSGVFENEKAVASLCRKVQRRIYVQAYVILGLLIAVIVLMPVLKPIYSYEALRRDQGPQELVALTAANMTDAAILSWAATTITEILTFGFGDFDQRMLAQKVNFTDEGWDSFTKAIRNQDMRADFKQRQLVLTSVPSNSPVIVGKGLDENQIYTWVVEMPIIMTYTTNNNVTSRQRGIVRLTIMRVPPDANVMGIGIKSWMLL